jgi:hypothetical protein
MTKADKDEIKGILHDYVSGVMARVDSKFEIIDLKLDRIEAQTTKHNGRMTVLEMKEARHTIECPNVGKIRDLEDHVLTTKHLKKWVVGGVSIIGILMSIFFILMKIFE